MHSIVWWVVLQSQYCPLLNRGKTSDHHSSMSRFYASPANAQYSTLGSATVTILSITRQGGPHDGRWGCEGGPIDDGCEDRYTDIQKYRRAGTPFILAGLGTSANLKTLQYCKLFRQFSSSSTGKEFIYHTIIRITFHPLNISIWSLLILLYCHQVWYIIW